MARKLGGQLKGGGESVPNLAPLVDVIMVLLIFFLLGATLNIDTEGVLETELDPRSGARAGAQVEVVPSVKIALEDVGDGAGVNIYLNEDLLPDNTFAGLQRTLRLRGAVADKSNPVVIGAEMHVRWRYVVRAMDAAVQAGFRNVQFAVSFQ